MVRWLHISDLHFGSGQAISNTMRKKLCEFIIDKSLIVDYLFITGDLVYAPKATKKDWDDAVDYIKELQILLNIESEHTFCVPGNHDVKRNAVREHLVSGLLDSYDTYDGNIDESILGSIDLTYDSFKKAYKAICGRAYKKHHFVDKKGKVNIFCIDTALTYSEMNQDRKLVLGTKLIEDMMEGVDNAIPGIVLAHHSFECMADPERIMLESVLKDNGVLLYLCGHEHKALFKQIQIINQKKHLYEYLCGSDMDRGPNHIITDMDIFVGQLNDDGETGFIEAWRFSKDNKDFLPDIEFSVRQNVDQLDGKHYFPKRNDT